jgi:tetratricopeptide (TPR) repeat protein
MAGVVEAQALATFLQGPLPEAAHLSERSARLFADIGDLLRVIVPRCTLGLVLTWMGRPEEGLSSVDDALELARTLGAPEQEAWCLWNRSHALAKLLRFEEARLTAESSLAIARSLHHQELTAAALLALGLALEAARDLPAAEATLRESLETARGRPIFSSFAAIGLATILIYQGNLDAAEQYVAAAMDEGPPVSHYEARLALARIAAARNDPRASEMAAEALESARAGGHLASVAELREVLASLRQAPRGRG